MKIAVAMSGGVDSSVTAALLVEAGHEVIGLAMKTHHDAGSVGTGPAKGCCSPRDLTDARQVASRLGISFYVLDYTAAFRDDIVLPFARAYSRGQTPNPCVDCNDRIKFRPLLARAELLGAERLATGHYARIPGTGDGPLRLERGMDRKKDQAYFLYRLGQTQLARLLFPLGDLTKQEVRARARQMCLPVADKDESQEICFVGPDGYAHLVEQTVGPMAQGDIIDRTGKRLGRHQGIHHFTLGQRRGLGIAAREPLFVTAIDPERNLVQVGPRAELLTEMVEIYRLTWVGEAPEDGAEVMVQQRYRESPKPARVHWQAADRIRLVFDPPIPRGAPGQAAVLFAGDRVLGGGILLAAADQVGRLL